MVGSGSDTGGATVDLTEYIAPRWDWYCPPMPNAMYMDKSGKSTTMTNQIIWITGSDNYFQQIAGGGLFVTSWIRKVV